MSGDVGEKIHVELEFLRLEFHHFISLLLPCVCSCSVFFFVAPPSVLLQPDLPASLVFFFIAPPSVLLQPDRLPSVSSFFLQIFCGFFSSSQIFILFWVLSLFSGFFLLFLGLYVFCSLFEIECKKLKIHVLWTWLLKTRDLCGIIMSNSANLASGKRVFEARDWYGTRVSKTWDASSHFSFKPILTYYILSLHNVNLQISPKVVHLYVSLPHFSKKFLLCIS